eukprot:2393524-Pyramimonas_sp.AAC.1
MGCFFKRRIRRRSCEDRADEQLASLYQHVALLRTDGKLAEAIPVAQQLTKLAKKAYGKKHHKVAVALDNLASLFQEMGKCDDALLFYERSLASYESKHGAERPEAATLYNLAMLLERMGRCDDALP